MWQGLGLINCTASEGDMRLITLLLLTYKSVSVQQNKIADNLLHVWGRTHLIINIYGGIPQPLSYTLSLMERNISQA